MMIPIKRINGKNSLIVSSHVKFPVIITMLEDHERGKGKGRYTESQGIIFQPLVTNCLADTPGPIPIKTGMHVTCQLF